MDHLCILIRFASGLLCLFRSHINQGKLTALFHEQNDANMFMANKLISSYLINADFERHRKRANFAPITGLSFLPPWETPPPQSRRPPRPIPTYAPILNPSAGLSEYQITYAGADLGFSRGWADFQKIFENVDLFFYVDQIDFPSSPISVKDRFLVNLSAPQAKF